MKTPEERNTENKNMYREDIHNQRNEGISPIYESSYKQATRQTKIKSSEKQKQKHYSY